MMNNKINKDTLIVNAGRRPFDHNGAVNPPVYHASTILFPDLESFNKAEQPSKDHRRITYGRHGTPTSFALIDAITALEEASGTVLTPSGLTACTIALLAVVKAGDHILVVDSVYTPTRRFCDNMLKRLNISTTYFDPLIGDKIKDLIQGNTSVIFMESPGTYTFEIMDVPAIVAIAKAASIVTMIDNTWATPYYYKPLTLGVDISIQAATKYIVGHSDVLIGTISANAALFPQIAQEACYIGITAGPDDIYLTQRGLRTLAVRLERHRSSALHLAGWLSNRSEIELVLHPALPSCPGHDIWKRDFHGSTGLFSVVLKPISENALAAFINSLSLFGLGWSWGGYESLCVPIKGAALTRNKPLDKDMIILRFHIGLEDITDLIADLEQAFENMQKVND